MKHNLATYFDTPASEEERNKLKAHIYMIHTIITSQIKADMVTKETNDKTQVLDPECQSDENEEPYGPKTMEMPDPMIYSSEKMEELLDVGDLPPHLHERP